LKPVESYVESARFHLLKIKFGSTYFKV
jgi:hypothetical protein